MQTEKSVGCITELALGGRILLGKTKQTAALRDLESAMDTDGLLPRGHLSSGLPSNHTELLANNRSSGPQPGHARTKRWMGHLLLITSLCHSHDTCMFCDTVIIYAFIFSNSLMPSKIWE